MGMFLEEPAHQIILISETVLVRSVRQQQQPWNFDSSGCQYVGSGSNGELLASERAHSHTCDPIAGGVGLDLEHIGMETNGNVIRVPDFVTAETVS